jgi:hypothetical protein
MVRLGASCGALPVVSQLTTEQQIRHLDSSIPQSHKEMTLTDDLSVLSRQMYMTRTGDETYEVQALPGLPLTTWLHVTRGKQFCMVELRSVQTAIVCKTGYLQAKVVRGGHRGG